MTSVSSNPAQTPSTATSSGTPATTSLSSQWNGSEYTLSSQQNQELDTLTSTKVNDGGFQLNSAYTARLKRELVAGMAEFLRANPNATPEQAQTHYKELLLGTATTSGRAVILRGNQQHEEFMISQRANWIRELMSSMWK